MLLLLLILLLLVLLPFPLAPCHFLIKLKVILKWSGGSEICKRNANITRLFVVASIAMLQKEIFTY